MSEFEYEFSNQDRQLTMTQIGGELLDNDYIRLTIYPQESLNNIVTLPNNEEGVGGQAIFFSSLSDNIFHINISPFGTGLDEVRLKPLGGKYGDTGIAVAAKNDFRIYKNTDGNIYIKPNEIFNTYGLPQGNYKIQIDFLRQLRPTTEELSFPTYVEEFDIGPLATNETPPVPDNNVTSGDAVLWNQVASRTDIANYITDLLISEGSTDSIPSAVDSGVEPRPYEDFINTSYQFIVKQISTSRKEVRLKLLNKNIENNSLIIDNLTNEFNNFELPFLDDGVTPNTNYKYQFKHVLNIGTGDHNPIMNYQFDRVTDGRDNQSIILKLYDTLPTQISTLSLVTIEREVLTTQTQDIFYFSDVPDVFFGDGLKYDTSDDWINPDGNDIGFQNYDEISSSVDQITFDSLISESKYNYPNLNTDFNDFENHTFFGSAVKKLQNFKTKIETIQGHYSEISSSLSAHGINLGEDSASVKTKRQNAFNKVQEEIKSFTPYERFLYFDGQSESTSSVPGIGKNYVSGSPMQSRDASWGGSNDNYEELIGFDGFDVVYKHSNLQTTNNHVDLFTDMYHVHKKPFFNYSSSIYLSFLIKGTEGIQLSHQDSNANNNNGMPNGIKLPKNAFYKNNLVNPGIVTGSEYQRYVYQVSQSYWVPNLQDGSEDFSTLVTDNDNFLASSTTITILSGSVKTGSKGDGTPYQIQDSTGFYPTTVITQSGAPFFGACMPAGELFRIHYKSGSQVEAEFSQSYVTDIKISFNDPSDVLPFDNIVHTGSATWTSWYNGMIDSASAYDKNNIHSFENNLPAYIQESSDYQDMKDFLNLQGEQYDLIRNHIDSMGTIHKRGYKKTDSPPNNTLTMLLSNMGWQAINPFTGNLNDTLGSYLSGVTSIDDIKNNTWRKTLNNLLYIYKSKGTKNSVRALLNTYGYPPDVLEFQEFGGGLNNPIMQESPGILKSSPPTSGIDTKLGAVTGSVRFKSKKEKLFRYTVGGVQDRVLNFDWYMDNADINSFEFVYKHRKTTNTQTILKSSGSGAQSLWDLRLVPSSNGASSSFEFRLSTANTGSNIDNDIGKSSVSMSTSYDKISDGQLWNIMLQRMTASVSGSGVNEYRLHAALQNDDIIQTYNYVTMSVSGGLTNTYITGGAAMTSSIHGLAYFANQNFVGSGSRHQLSSSNLFIGETLTGSLAEIKAWSTPLSISKFRQHTLNKFSTVGNTIKSYKDELVYHFKLNENYNSSSISASSQDLTIVDSAPKTTLTTDYSIQKLGGLFTGSLHYGFDIINCFTFSIQDNTTSKNINNTIVVNPSRKPVSNLNPLQPAVNSFTNPLGKRPQFRTSNRLELYRSPQSFVDNFILDNLDGFNFETLYANPVHFYSQSYFDFENFKNEFFDSNPIEVNVNQFIRAHENMFNHSIVEGVKSVVPARSTFSGRNSNIGVEIKPTILEKQKYENERHSIETNPNTITGSILFIENTEFKQSSFISTFESIKSGSINTIVNESVMTGSTLIFPKSGSIGVNTSPTGSIELIRSSSNISTLPAFVGSFEEQKSGSISSIPSQSGSLLLPNTGSMNITINGSGSGILISKDGTVDYALIANESYESVHKNWGTSSADVQFINYAAESGSYGTFNTYHIDTRFHFLSIGDMEYYSASSAGGSDFSNSDRFYNRTIIDDDFHSSVTYDSKNFATGSGIYVGKMMGKTRYFDIDGDGNLILPSNHVTKFSNPFKEQMIDGTQNINPGFLNVQYEDYSSASFYRVKVTGGETEIIVKTGKGNTDNDDKIIY